LLIDLYDGKVARTREEAGELRKLMNWAGFA